MSIENLATSSIQEPQWILERIGEGPLHWRRSSTEHKSRVKFLFDVEVKEFQRGAHEMDDGSDSNRSCYYDETNPITMSITCLICLFVTVMLPWYIMIGNGNTS